MRSAHIAPACTPHPITLPVAGGCSRLRTAHTRRACCAAQVPPVPMGRTTHLTRTPAWCCLSGPSGRDHAAQSTLTQKRCGLQDNCRLICVFPREGPVAGGDRARDTPNLCGCRQAGRGWVHSSPCFCTEPAPVAHGVHPHQRAPPRQLAVTPVALTMLRPAPVLCCAVLCSRRR